MVELPYYNTFFRTAAPPTIELSRVLADLTPGRIAHTFFSSSGSEANDTIVRLVRRYWDLQGKPAKKTFISRTYAYHGSTMPPRAWAASRPCTRWEISRCPGSSTSCALLVRDGRPDETPEETGARAAKALEEKIAELGADRVAAFIGEPVIGAGGVVVPPDNYWPEIQRICRENDILLVCDEVITGFGRTGECSGRRRSGSTPTS